MHLGHFHQKIGNTERCENYEANRKMEEKTVCFHMHPTGCTDPSIDISISDAHDEFDRSRA